MQLCLDKLYNKSFNCLAPNLSKNNFTEENLNSILNNIAKIYNKL